MRNILKKSLFLVTFILGASLSIAQTTVTWIPTAADVTALTNTSVHVVNVGSGSKSFQIYSTRPFFNNNEVKLAWDASANAVKMTDNGMDKAGIAIYVPATSDNISNIVVYMHTSNSRKTLYASGNPCPNSGTVTSSALAKTSTGYTFWNETFVKDKYYVCGGRSGGSGDSFFDKVEVTFTSGGGGGGDVAVTGVSLNKTSTSIQVGASEQLTATVEPNNATNKAVTWSSNTTSVATVDNNGNVTAVSEGTATITVTTQDGNKTATCTVTVTPASSDPVAVTGVSLNKTSTTLTVGGSETLTETVQPSNATNKAVNWSCNPTSVATVDSNGKVTAVAEGTATITVTTQDGNKTATCTVTVNAAPSTTLSLHLPEVYEASSAAGGYNTPLATYGGREYEVYYINRDGSGKLLSIATSNVDKAGNICDDSQSTAQTTVTKDGWAKISASNGTGGDQNATAQAEYQTSLRSVKFNNNSHELVMHIQGYDEFSFYGKDNNTTASKNKMFEVYIDNVKQYYTPADYSIHRFPITTGEHLIRITAIGGSDSKLCAFSLRVSQEPRAKWLDGNDSTQIVYQTQEMDPIIYYTKYNNIAGAETVLEWVGTPANGISIAKTHGDALGDTLAISGTANCQCGVYHYNVVSKYNGNPTRTIPGTLHVATSLRPSSRDSVFEAFKGEEIDEIAFTYTALSEDSVKLTWKTAAPAGITGHGVSGTKKYVISGTPSVTGDYEFTVSIGGGETVFKGLLKITEVDFGNNPVMYLYKNSLAYENDGVYQYLKSFEGGSVNLIPRKAKESGAREPYNYSSYKWVLISEDVDADNAEILDIVRNNASNLPVLNMKSFSYAKGRLGWGEPNNGSIDSTTNNGCNIYVEQPTHPIFKDITATGGKIQVLNKVSKRGVMPIDINNCPGTFCLATAYTRNIEDYYTDGEKQTIIHEIPVGLNGRTKNYICFPLANTKDNLTSNGKKLLRNIVNYLLGTTHFSGLPELKMTGFSVAGYTASINQEENLIELNLTLDQFDAADSLRAVKPVITLADGKTHVIPGADEVLDLRYTTFLPKTFVVTDYINRRAYSFFVNITRTEGIDEVYEVGQWVNVFDIYGRKIATTNEDIYTMDLPRGMYIIVTEKGQSIKLMK